MVVSSPDGARRWRRWPVLAMAVAAAGAGIYGWWATDTAPYPYSQRWLLDLPLPWLSQARLDRMLELQPGQRVLEIGPGTGLQALATAPRLGREGRLDVVDVQQPMLDHVMRRAREAGVSTIVAHRSDARDLPFVAGTFDAAYLVTALGEIPNPADTLDELRRVLKPSGRVVVGEFFDRHQVTRSRLAVHAREAGLRVHRVEGPPFAYYADLRPAGSSI